MATIDFTEEEHGAGPDVATSSLREKLPAVAPLGTAQVALAKLDPRRRRRLYPNERSFLCRTVAVGARRDAKLV
jgi:hypothetical protein